MEKDVKVKVLECVTLLKMTLLFENTPNNRTEPNFPITNLNSHFLPFLAEKGDGITFVSTPPPIRLNPRQPSKQAVRIRAVAVPY